MAFANNTQISPTGLNGTLKLYGHGVKLNNQDVELNFYTKLTGDTTATINSTLEDIKGVIVIDSTSGIVSGAVPTVTKSGGLGVVALTSLGSGTSGLILIYGSRAR